MSAIFEQIRVIDFSNNVAGPTAAAMLADLGAEVIKIERPNAGDDSRTTLPLWDKGALQNIWYNRGKKSVEISLKDPDAQSVLHKLIDTADVVIESFKVGEMKKFSLDYETVKAGHPGLIYCSISACGQTGGYAGEPGFDIIAQGMSGMMDLCGEPEGGPTKAGPPIGDYVASYNAFGAVSAALYHRERTGQGQYIDISLLDGLLYCNTQIDNAATCEAHPTRTGRHHATAAPFGVYMGSRGQSVIIATPAPAAWKRLCGAMDMPALADDPRFDAAPRRVQNLDELVAVIEGWLKTFDSIDDAIAILKRAKVPCGKIKSTYEAAHDPVLWDRGSLVEIPTPTGFDHKTFRGRGPAARYSLTPAVMRPAPNLGEHTREVLSRLGWTEEQITRKQMEWTGRGPEKGGAS